MRYQFRDCKTVCAKAANLGESDPRLFTIVNEAQEALLHRGKWVGTVQTFRFCVPSSACITWPREIETPEAINICGQPGTIRSPWYEFLENGFGELDEETNLCRTLVDRGESVAFDEVIGTGKKLAVYADKDGNTGKYINLQFWDNHGQWVRTTFGGEEINGEKIAIPAKGTYAYTTNECKASGLLAVQKDTTVGMVRLYEYNTSNGALRPLAYYQPDENIPKYRQSFIPELSQGNCDQTPVTVRAKLRFIPATTDDSWLIIPNIRALKLAVAAVRKENEQLFSEANTLWVMALSALDAQVAHHMGSGEKSTVQMESAATWGGGVPYVI